MSIRNTALLGSCLFALCPIAAAAQQTPVIAQSQPETAPTQEYDPDSGIVVTGARLRGQLDVEQAPVLELNEEDIQAVGATSVADLIAAIAPQTGSSRGRGGGSPPVFLVNGIRISSFRELRSYPPEAVAKVEVLPEEVAQRFGYPPDRRVVNMILKDDYSSREVELEFEGPDRGGYFYNEQEFTLLQINNGARLNVNLEANDTSLLTEAERGVVQEPGSIPSVAGDPDPALYRSLIADSRELQATANWAKADIGSGSSFTLNGTYERSDSRSLSGLNSVLLTDAQGNSALRTFGASTPLERRTSSDSYSLGGSMNRRLGLFDLTTTVDATLVDSETQIDRRADTQDLRTAALAGTLALDGDLPTSADAGYDLATSQTISATSKATLVGTPLTLPAGDVSTTFDVGLDWKRIESEDTRTALPAQFTRRRLSAGANVTIPIAKSYAAWGAVGDLSLNLGAGVEDLSDFGALENWSAGLTWSPAEALTISATHIVSKVAPSLTELGSPRIENLNVSVYDFVNGETVLATVISGGNANLVAETQRDWKFSANWELPFWENTRLSAEYIRNRSRNVTSSFPALTAEVEAAFPDRVVRDTSGQLVSIDRRPVTFARTRADRLVFSLTTRGSFGEARPQESDAAQSQGQARPGAAGEGRGPGRFGGPGGAPTEEQRARFMAFREKLCADDGEQYLDQLVTAVENGEDLSERFPDFDPERAARMLDRLRGEDGKIDRTRLAAFRERICSFDPSAMQGSGPGAAPQAQSGGSGRRGGGMPFGRGGDGRGRYFVNLTHTLELQNEILVASGGPLLDLLDGDATGDSGLSRHSTRLEAGMFRNGWGARLSGSYTGKARIDGSGLPGSSDLTFGDLATFDIRLFADLGQVLKQQEGFLKNFRISLRADNVFDARRRVTDQNGDVPLTYQPFLIDPTGRYLGVDFRKLF